MIGKSFKSYMITGLVVWLPIIATLVIMRFLIDLLDQTMSLLPQAYHPEKLIGMKIPGFGVVLSLFILIATGILATNFFGQKFMSLSERVLDKIPLVRTIYNATKQMIQALVSTNSQAFRKVLLVEYPRKGMWSVAFQTGEVTKEIDNSTENPMVTIFIPTTPNPTSGFLMIVPKEDVKELEMTTDEALKFIISLGVMPPGAPKNSKKVKDKL